MFKTIDYLKEGNETQRSAYLALSKLNILNDLAHYTPILCGTIPIDIHVQNSDLDIIMEVHNFIVYRDEVKELYGKYEGFQLQDMMINNIFSIVTNFRYETFEFELFAQPICVDRQHAYLHMLIEHRLLLEHPHIKEEIIHLKRLGVKTEPAFAQVFDLEGDPYKALLDFGIRLGIIS